MRFADIPIGEGSPSIVNAVIEIPRGSSNKYEYIEALDAFTLDRALYSPLYYPTEYGWVAGTLSADGDPLDVLVFSTHPTFTGCVIAARPIGGLHMHDEAGEDFKVIAVAETDPRYREVLTLDDLLPHVRAEIANFFSIYKQLEEKAVEILGWLSLDEAHKIILECARRHQESLGYQH